MAHIQEKYMHLLKWSEDTAVRNAVEAALVWLDNDLEIEESFAVADVQSYNDAASSAGRIRHDYINFLVQLWKDVFEYAEIFNNANIIVESDEGTIKSIWESEYFGCFRYMGAHPTSYVGGYAYWSTEGCYISLTHVIRDVSKKFDDCENIPLENSWYYDIEGEEFRTRIRKFRDVANDYEAYVDSLKRDLALIWGRINFASEV